MFQVAPIVKVAEPESVADIPALLRVCSLNRSDAFVRLA